METTCETCGKNFSYRNKGTVRKFCSINCAYPDKNYKEYEAPCPICGDLFLKVESSNKNKRKLTCGKQKCQKSRKNHPNYSHTTDVLCDGCGITFPKLTKAINAHLRKGYKKHYCSDDCRNNHLSNIAKLKTLSTCESGGIDPTSTIVCIKCNQPKEILKFRRPGRNICKDCHYLYQRRRWIQRKIWAIEYLGGKCKDCNSVKHWTAYDFHHRDPLTKEYEWSKLKLRSRADMIEELDKCDLLCSCCHRFRHFTENESDHGID